jgi:hypothetical protein
MKFELRLNGVPVQIKPGGSYEMELNNPMAEFDSVLGSRGMNIELADSVTNHEVLGWINDPRSASSEMLLKAEQYASGNLIDVGYCYVRDAKRGGLLDFTSNLSQFFGIYQSLKLSEIDLGDIGTPVWNSTRTNTWNSGGFILPTVLNSVFFKDGTAPGGWDGKMNSYSSGYLTDTPKVPMFFLKYLLKKVADLAGVRFVGDVWEHVDFGRLYMYNSKVGFSTAEIRLFMPDVTVAELLLSFRKYFNVAMMFDVANKTIRLDFADDKLKANPVVDWSDKMGKIQGGIPVKTDGILLEFVNDSGDGLAKDAYFGSGQVPGVLDYPKTDIVKKISTSMVPILMVSGLPAVEIVGVIEPELTDARTAIRIGRWNPTIGDGDASFGGVEMNWAGLTPNYWAKTAAVNAESYLIDEDAALDANDVAWVAECYRGERPDAAIVHAQGVTWEVLKVTVPYGKSRMCRVKMRRV